MPMAHVISPPCESSSQTKNEAIWTLRPTINMHRTATPAAATPVLSSVAELLALLHSIFLPSFSSPNTSSIHDLLHLFTT